MQIEGFIDCDRPGQCHRVRVLGSCASGRGKTQAESMLGASGTPALSSSSGGLNIIYDLTPEEFQLVRV